MESFCAIDDIMVAGCNLSPVFNYSGSSLDCWVNYTTLAILLTSVIICTSHASGIAAQHPTWASWFWLPFTIILFGMQIFADCATDNVGISAVWSAYAGFLLVGYRRLEPLWKGARAAVPATLVSLTVWCGVCVYYAVVEEALTTFAHLVAFAVGMAAARLFEVVHKIPRSADGRGSQHYRPIH